LYAINSSGTGKWKFKAGGYLTGQDSSPAFGADGNTIYFGGGDGLYAVCAKAGLGCAGAGKLKWKFTTYSAVSSSPAISADGTIYFGSADGKLWAVNDTGFAGALKSGWPFLTTAGGFVDASPAIGPDATIYVGSSNYLYAINGPPRTAAASP